MSNTVQRRAASDQVLAMVRDKYALAELEYHSVFFNDLAGIALACQDPCADTLALAGACILIVKDLLEEQGASQ